MVAGNSPKNRLRIPYKEWAHPDTYKQVERTMIHAGMDRKVAKALSAALEGTPWIQEQANYLAIERWAQEFDIGSGKQYATYVVAASNSTDAGRAAADFRCDGVADDVEINAALALLDISAAPLAGGKVLLLEGSYKIANTLFMTAGYQTLQGMGKGTELQLSGTAVGASLNGLRSTVRDLAINGQSNAGVQGVDVSGPFSLVEGLYVESCGWDGIAVNGGHYTRVRDCHVQVPNTALTGITAAAEEVAVQGCWVEGGAIGIYNSALAVRAMISNNHISYSDIGIKTESDQFSIHGNVILATNQHGIWVVECADGNILGNGIYGGSQEADATYDGIFLSGNADRHNIQYNMVRHGGGAAQFRYGLNISAATCDKTFAPNNDLYLSGRTSPFNDAGTNTNTVPGNRIA